MVSAGAFSRGQTVVDSKRGSRVTNSFRKVSQMGQRLVWIEVQGKGGTAVRFLSKSGVGHEGKEEEEQPPER